MKKICSKCKKEKSIYEFKPDKRYYLEVAGWCYKCVSEYAHARLLKERQKHFSIVGKRYVCRQCGTTMNKLSTTTRHLNKYHKIGVSTQ